MSIQLPQKFLTKPAEIARWQWHLSQGKTNDTLAPWKSDRIFLLVLVSGGKWWGHKTQNAFFFQTKTIYVYGNSNMEKRHATKQKLLLAVSFSLQTGMLTTLGLTMRSKLKGSQFSRSNSSLCRSIIESTDKNDLGWYEVSKNVWYDIMINDIMWYDMMCKSDDSVDSQ